MSQFGGPKQASDGAVRKIYTGVENFKVIAINPNEQQLKTLYGDNAKPEEYLGEQELKDGTKVPNLRLTFHLDNEAEEGEESIKTRINFWVSKTHMKTLDGTKTQVINLYGDTAWLTPEQISSDVKVIDIGGKGTYMFPTDSMRPCYRGEAELISFLRNLLNLPSLDKAENASDAASQLSESDWNTLFNGNFSLLQGIISSVNNKIGVLLGAKNVDGTIYQDVFSRNTLRQYVKNSGKFSYLKKQLDEAQEAGAFGNTDFGPSDFKLRPYVESATKQEQEELFTGSTDVGGLFDED